MTRLLKTNVSNCLDCPAHHPDCCGDGSHATCHITYQTIGPSDVLNDQGSVENAFPKFCPLKEVS